MQKLWFCVIILAFNFSHLLSADFQNYFWKWSNSYPLNPVVSHNDKALRLTSRGAFNNQKSFAIYSVPISLQENFKVKFTLNFGALDLGSADGITFNFWGVDVNNCDSATIASDTIPALRANPDSIINPLIWNLARKKYNDLKNAITPSGKLGIYNYELQYCPIRPAVSVEFDTHFDPDSITNNCYSYGRSVLDDIVGGWNHISVTGLGIPTLKYVNDGLIAGLDYVDNGNDFKIEIDWNATEKIITIHIADDFLHTSVHQTNQIDFPAQLTTLSPTYSTNIVLVGFTATTYEQSNNQYIKDFEFIGKNNAFLGAD